MSACKKLSDTSRSTILTNGRGGFDSNTRTLIHRPMISIHSLARSTMGYRVPKQSEDNSQNCHILDFEKLSIPRSYH